MFKKFRSFVKFVKVVRALEEFDLTDDDIQWIIKECNTSVSADSIATGFAIGIMLRNMES